MADVNLDTLNIEVRSNTSKAVANLRRLKDSLDRISSSLDLKGVSSMASMLRSLAASMQGFQNATTAGANISKVASGLKRLESVSPDKIREIAAALKEYGAAVATIPQNAPSFARMQKTATGAKQAAESGAASEAIQPEDAQRAEGAVSGYSESLEKAAQGEENVKQKAFDMNGALRRVESVANLVTGAIEKLGQVVRRAFDGVAEKIQPFADKIRGMLPNIVGLGKESRHAKNGTEDLGKAFKKNLWTVIKYTFGVRSLYILVRRLKGVIKDAFNNLVQYSADANRAISSMSSSLGALKNSLAVAFTPIVEAIAPAITYLLDLLTAAFNAIGRFMAALTGKGYAVQAVKVQKDYAASLGATAGGANDAADAVDNLADSLSVLGFDELNQLDADKTKDSGNGGGGGGGGGAGDGADISEYFTTVNLVDGVSEFGRKLREAFLAQDWDELGKVIADKMNEVLQFVYDHIRWDVVGEKITYVVNAITETFNSWVDNFDWDLLGHTIGAGFQTAFNTAYVFIKGMDWKGLGSGIATTVNGFMDEVDFVHIGETIGAGFMIVWNWLNGFVHTIHWGDIGKSIADAITGFFREYSFSDIADTIATFLNGLFEAIYNFAMELEWGEIAENIINGVATFLEEFEWEENGKKLNAFLMKLLNTINEIVAGIDWYSIGRNIGLFLSQIDWGAILSTVVNTVFSVLGGIIGGIWDSSGVGKLIVVAIAGWFTATKILPIANSIAKAFTDHSIYQIIAKAIISLFKKIFASKAVGDTIANGVATAVGKSSSSIPAGGSSAGGMIAPLLGIVGAAIGTGLILDHKETDLGGYDKFSQNGKADVTSVDQLGNTISRLSDQMSISEEDAEALGKQLNDIARFANGADVSVDGVVRVLRQYGVTAEDLGKIISKVGFKEFTGDTVTNLNKTSASLKLITDTLSDTEDAAALTSAALNSFKTYGDITGYLELLNDQGRITSGQFATLTRSLDDMESRGLPVSAACQNMARSLYNMGVDADAANVKIGGAERIAYAAQSAVGYLREATGSAEAGVHYVQDAIDKMNAGTFINKMESVKGSVATMAESIANAAQSSVQSFGTLKGDGSDSLADLTAQLNDSITSFQNWERDLTELAQYGADGVHTAIYEDILQDLAAMGPASAPYIQLFKDAIASGNDQAIKDFNEAWKTKTDLGGAMDAAGQGLLTATATLAGKQYDASLEVGENSSKGIVDGFSGNKKEFVDAAYDMADTGHEAYRLADDQHSPSAIWKSFGLNDAKGLAEGIREGADVIKTQITNLVLIITSNFSKNSKRFTEAGSNIATTLLSSLTEKKGALANTMQSIMQAMLTKVTSFAARFKNAAMNIATQMINALSAKRSVFTSTMNSILASMQSRVTSSASAFRSLGANMMTYIAGGISASASVANAITNMISGASGMTPAMRSLGRTLGEVFVDGFKSVKIPVPHLYVKGNQVMTQGNYVYAVPDWDVKWYAKGGLFTNSSMIGVGEAGNEAVLPLENDRAMKAIASAILTGVDNNILGSDAMANAVERGMVSALMRNTSSKEPTFNVIVKTQNDEVLARAVTRGQKKLDYRFNPVAQY